jgi:hypothetical protein
MLSAEGAEHMEASSCECLYVASYKDRYSGSQFMNNPTAYALSR